MSRAIIIVVRIVIFAITYACFGAPDEAWRESETYQSSQPQTMNTMDQINGYKRLKRDISQEFALNLLQRNRNIICPATDICEMPTNLSGSQCCTYCTCEDHCVRTESCCFPNSGQFKDVTLSECLYGTTMENANVENPAFTMITECPSSQENQDDIACGNMSVNAYGSLHPVMSLMQNDKTYKNKHCAECNGIGEYYSIISDLYCKHSLKNDSYGALQVAAGVTKALESGDIYPNSFLVFQHNMFPTKPCYANVISDCRADDFILHSGLNATKSEIWDACYSGLNSPYIDEFGRVFKNMFCYICNGGHDEPQRSCLPRDPRQKLMNVRANAVLFLEINDELLQMLPLPYPQSQIACRRLHNTVDCRSVICPIGEVYGGTYLACTWLAQMIQHNEGMHILIKLSLDQPVAVPDNSQNIEIIYDAPILPNSPVQLVLSRVYVDRLAVNDHSTYFHDMYVDYFINVLMEPVMKTLSNIEWNVRIDGERFKASYEVSRFSSRLTVQHALGNPSDDTSAIDEYDDIVLLSVIKEQTLLEVFTNHNMNSPPALMITKLFDCNLIELTLDEVRFVLNKRVVIILDIGVVLYDGEFVVVKDVNGTESVRVCMEDVGYRIDDGSIDISFGLGNGVCTRAGYLLTGSIIAASLIFKNYFLE